MDQKEQDALLGKIKSQVTETMEAAQKGFLKEADFNESITEIQKSLKDLDKTKEITDLGESVQKMAEEFGKLKNTQDDVQKQKGFNAMLAETLLTKADYLKTLNREQGQAASFSVKSAGTMLRANILPSVATAAPYMLTAFESGVTDVPRRDPFIRQLMNARPISTQYAAWAEKVNLDGGAGTTAEGAAKTQADFDIQEATKKVEKITSYMKTSRENLMDVQAMQNEIESELMTLLELKFDEQLLSGNGTSPNLKGLREYATAFSVAGTDLSTGIDFANNFDVIRAAVWQVRNNLFSANFGLINPVDAAMMDLTKTTQGAYVIPPFTTSDGRRIAGITLVENTGVTAGDFLIGDFSKANLRIREEINFSIGYENDDFTKNLVTILGELRAVHYVKANHTGAFVKGTFATAKALLSTP